MNSIPLYRMEQRFVRKKGRTDLAEIHRAKQIRKEADKNSYDARAGLFFYGGISRMVEEGLAIIKKQKVHKAKIEAARELRKRKLNESRGEHTHMN